MKLNFKSIIKISLLILCLFTLNSSSNINKNEIVLIHGPEEYIFYLEGNSVKIKINKEARIKIGSKIYDQMDDYHGKIGYKKYEITKDIKIQNNKLYYKNKKVILPKGIEIRAFYNQAILWHNYVILLCRTSFTDYLQKDMPHITACELVYFNLKNFIAKYDQVHFEPPKDYSGILVLNPVN